MLNLIVSYCVALVALIVGDALWLSYFAKAVFRPTLGGILLDDPRWFAAGAFYLLFTAGLTFFAVTPAMRQGSWTMALASGALFGFMAYMTYDLTNLATIKVWTFQLALVDTAWGALLSGMAATAAYAAASRFTPS